MDEWIAARISLEVIVESVFVLGGFLVTDHTVQQPFEQAGCRSRLTGRFVGGDRLVVLLSTFSPLLLLAPLALRL